MGKLYLNKRMKSTMIQITVCRITTCSNFASYFLINIPVHNFKVLLRFIVAVMVWLLNWYYLHIKSSITSNVVNLSLPSGKMYFMQLFYAKQLSVYFLIEIQISSTAVTDGQDILLTCLLLNEVLNNHNP
jgi:hypothetical protein